jgi:predicted nucleic acid-binding protein
MASVVCNSSPIIGLCIIKKLNLLWELFDEVYITEEVYSEVVENNQLRHHGEQELTHAVVEGKIKIYKVKNCELVEAMIGRLHRGELEVIQAARELSLSTVIIDDRPARNRAKDMLLKPLGIIGILQLSKSLGKIGEIKVYLDSLIQEDYRISKRLYFEVLKAAGEEERIFESRK